MVVEFSVGVKMKTQCRVFAIFITNSCKMKTVASWKGGDKHLKEPMIKLNDTVCSF